MGEFYGSLQDIGLPEILSFLKGLGKTGSLRISHGRWTGEASLNGGGVTGASFNGEEGVSALESIMLGLPTGSFTFTDGLPTVEPNVALDPDELHSRLSAFAEERTALAVAVPSLGAVPRVAKAPGTTGEVVLDGATVETLLAVNGERTIAEIARAHGLLPTARELMKLLDHTLISVDVPEAETAAARPDEGSPEDSLDEEPALRAPELAEIESPPAARGEADADRNEYASSGLADSNAVAARALSEPAAEAAAGPPQPPASSLSGSAIGTGSVNPFEEQASASVLAPEMGAPEEASVGPAASGPCPNLGYVDDPANRYSRPTQLHRCFVSGTAERVSTPEQRDLCLTDHFPTCPRFIAAGATVAPAPVEQTALPDVERPKVQAGSIRSNRSDPRPAREHSNGGSSRSFPVRDLASPLAVRAPTTVARPIPRPSPLAREPAPAIATQGRERLVRAGPASRPTEPTPAAAEPDLSAAQRAPAQSVSARRLMPAVLFVAAAATAVLAIAILVIRAANPQLPDVTDEEVSRLATSVAVGQGTNPSSAPPPLPGNSPPSIGSPAAPLRTALDVNFAASPPAWPNNPSSTAWFADGEYHVLARQPGQFVAIGAPTGERFEDIVASATFRKVGGPAGGGYGLVIRDQGPGPRDGVNQIGQYYVLEVGDRGEYGIWRREDDHWLDLIPWTQSDLVPQGNATNELMVLANNQELTFLVNGKVLANLVGAVLRDGGVGIFVGGDFNEVVVERFVIQVPS